MKVVQRANFNPRTGSSSSAILMIQNIRFYSQDPRSEDHAKMINDAVTTVEKIELMPNELQNHQARHRA